MEKDDGAVGVEGLSAADSPEVCGDDGAMTDQGEAGRRREPSGAEGGEELMG